MASPLVATKLFVPTRRTGLVARPRLRERLDHGAKARLTLVSAPAGFGKTTLIAEWLANASKRASAWLSLDRTDNDPGTFWSDVIAALQTAAPGVGATMLSSLQSGQQLNEHLLAGLVNDLSAAPVAVHLVLDDYHVIDQPDVHAGITFLVEHLPPQIHIAIATRVDPPFPLARLRAQGELVEVRSADLRFTGEEATAYFNREMHLGLSPRNISALEERTEGWIAALQLAALSMQGREDVTAFVAGFAGNNRYVFDYLVEEVLQRQSEAVRSFLLRTSFLDRLSGPLCDAVTASRGGGALLDALHRQNLFLVPLDDRRQWYRYHHLFADVLQAHFVSEGEAELPILHRRASDWYEQNGERPKAIDHALAGADIERAAALIELAIPETSRNRGEAIIRGWARVLPAELVRARPVLGIGLVGGLVSRGEFEGIEDRLRDVERGLATLAQGGAPAHNLVVIDRDQLPRLPGAIELYRAALAQVRGDIVGVIHHAQRVLDLAPADDDLGRAGGTAFLGIANWSAGNLEAARCAWAEGRDGLQRAGHIADTLGVSIALADITLAQGRLGDAIEACDRALQLAAAQGGPPLRGTADMHAGLSELHRERNDLDAARQHLATSQELGARAGLPQHPYRWRIAAAQLRRDEGDFDGAIVLLDEAERLYISDFFPYVRPVSAIRARMRIAQGRLDEALRWQRERGFTIGDELSYLREYEHITVARLLLAQGAGGTEVRLFLDRLLESAVSGGRMRSVIEISLLQALASRAAGDGAVALVAVERALTIGEPEGYVRLFVDEGEAIASLLRAALKRGITPAYTRRLLAAFGPAERAQPAHADLIEPLSERELDVLRLLRSDLGGLEIARELMISLNTMRSHTKNIYEKLGVTSRRSAVHRADELRLFGHTQPN